MKTLIKKIAGILANPVRFALKLYNDDHVATNSATITLFMITSLIPMLMILLWVMSKLLISPDELINLLNIFIPEDFMILVKKIINDLYEKSLSKSALSVTIIVALWTASKGISTLVTGLNRVYKRDEQRNWFFHRALCLLYTGIFIFLIIVVLGFIVYGMKFQEFLLTINPGLDCWMWLIAILQNAVAIGGMLVFFIFVYNIFPEKRLPYLKQLPGALISTIGWYSFSIIYSNYIRTSKNLAYMYGSLTLIIAFIVWMYVCINIILIGGEINFLYNNRYYYKLFIVTKEKIQIEDYINNSQE